jgi:hypothetical protein
MLLQEMKVAGIENAAFGFGTHLPTAAHNNFVITDKSIP